MIKAPEVSKSERIAEWIAVFCGSIAFLAINFFVFLFWIVLNTFTLWRFDAYPFSFLTLSVSLEAIFLSIFVLMSENKQAERDRCTVEHDAMVNRLAEKEICDIKALLVELRATRQDTV